MTNMQYLSSPSSDSWSVMARGFNEFGFSLIRGSNGDEELSILSLNLIWGRWMFFAVSNRTGCGPELVLYGKLS
jgi:lysophospholipid acyltransferase (LPLAT)-like uncharacterized protein